MVFREGKQENGDPVETVACACVGTIRREPTRKGDTNARHATYQVSGREGDISCFVTSDLGCELRLLIIYRGSWSTCIEGLR